MIKFIYVDLFCGAGGTSTGVEKARYERRKFAKVVACVNHDPVAIESHAANHKGTKHFIEDIRTLEISRLVEIVEAEKLKHPEALVCLWASLECTNFSKAKGGMPRDADSRTLAEFMFRYIESLNPDYIDIENVEEFMAWGPLDENGKPLNRKNGRDYVRWTNKVQSYGYRFDWHILNAADYGAYTSRRRYFAQFAKGSLPIVWPEATHSKNPDAGMFGGLKKWKAVKEVLDFSDEGRSIFGRKKPLSEKTLQRIYAGLVKYVAKGDDSFITKYFSGNPQSKVISVDGPSGAIKTKDSHSVLRVKYILKYNSTSKEGVHNPPSIEEPCPTIATQNRLGVVNAFVAKYYGTGGQLSSIEEPAGTITTKDRFATVWLDKCYGSGKHNHQSIEQPAGTVTTNDHHQLAQAQFLFNHNYSNKGNSIEEPAPTLLASRKHYYLLNPQYKSKGRSIEDPCFTLIARMDKMPPYLVSTDKGKSAAIFIYPEDCETMRKIKLFMAAYGIFDIKMRMLKVKELMDITGFPEGYELKGNQTQQKKFIGNAVPPVLPEKIVTARYQAILSYAEAMEAA
jgi:DNA (cytosine-5)-methyltransferase 1